MANTRKLRVGKSKYEAIQYIKSKALEPVMEEQEEPTTQQQEPTAQEQNFLTPSQDIQVYNTEPEPEPVVEEPTVDEEELRKAYYQDQKSSLVPKRGTSVTNPRERSGVPVTRRNAKISSSR